MRCLFTVLLALLSLTPVYAEEAEIVIAMLETELGLNPLDSFTAGEGQLFTGLYEGLVSYHPQTLRPVPAVASEWEVEDDGRRYRFHLRNDARYHTGERITAEHFRETWLEMIDPQRETAYSFLFDVITGAEEYRTGEHSDPNAVGIRALSDEVLEVELDSPAPHFLAMLPHHSFVVVHPDLLDREDWSDPAALIYNGPFVVAERSADELVLRRNPEYWDRDSVGADRIRILLHNNPVETTARFNGGEIDWVHSGIALGQVLDPGTIVVNPMFSTSYFFFATHSAPWRDPQVRRALALALPWDAIRDEEIHFNPAETLIPAIPGYPRAERLQEQDPGKARELLAEAGYPQGAELPEIVVRTPGGPENERIYALMEDAWSEILGASASHQVIEHPRYFESLKDSDYTLGTVTWIGDYTDPLTFLQLWSSRSNLNDARYSDAEYDGLLRDSMWQTGRERLETLAAAEARLLTGAVVLPISHSPAVNLVDREILGGWHPNPLDIHPLKALRLQPVIAPPGFVQLRAPEGRFSPPLSHGAVRAVRAGRTPERHTQAGRSR